MSQLHVRQIQNHLKNLYGTCLDTTDLPLTASDADRSRQFSSRALAAYALQMLSSGLDATEAASQVTDGGQDQGIDALHFDSATQTLFIVQSKWHDDGRGSIQVGDTHKVIAGVKKLLEDESATFNEKLLRAWEAIREEFLESTSAKVVLCFVHTGATKLSDDVLQPVNDYFEQVNDVSPIISLRSFAQKDIHDSIASGAEGKPIDLEILLQDWGRVSQPFDAVYGRVAATDVATWIASNSPDRLLSQNIRKILPDSAINDSIAETLQQTPGIFWYYNNGITVLCQSITQKAGGAGSRDSGVFVASGATIVNGAQTAGAIARVTEQAKLASAHVQVRIISLKGCPDDFAKSVTRATNTQNRVEAKDFASLDPVQERLRKELLVAGRHYLIKAGERVADQSNQCTAEEAAVALSCAESIALATLAKNSIGRIWDDANDNSTKSGNTYRRVFPENLDCNYLWNCVETLRLVDSGLRTIKGKGRQGRIAVHGNRFVARQVFKSIDRSRLHSTNYNAKEHVSVEQVRELLAKLDELVIQEYPTGYAAAIFKNQQKCQHLDDELASSY